MPKSLTATRPAWLMSTLSGLKSRWTRPARCAAASPRPAAKRTWSASRQVCGRSSHPRSVPPSTNSIARNTCSPKVPTSWMATTLGCASRAIAWASRSSRACPVLSVGVVAGPTCSSLIATFRSSFGSNAA
jgi:hypothetical protein